MQQQTTISFWKISIISGFALFSMFFGSGNLIFPLSIGIEAQSQYLPAALGLLLTGIIVPLAGLISVIISRQESLTEFFKPLTKPLGWSLVFMMVALLGPFGVIPRCIMVAAGSVSLVLPTVNYSILSIVVCALALMITLSRKGIVEIIGRYLTPILLATITTLIIFGIIYAPDKIASDFSSQVAFKQGFFEGYQTMDLLAAVFFSLIIQGHLKSKFAGDNFNFKIFMKMSLLASTICASLLAAVYLGFILLGASYSPDLVEVAANQRLVVIAGAVLGDVAMPIVTSVIFLACLTTMATLSIIFADFIRKYFFKSMSKANALLLTFAISFVFSLWDFSILAGWLAQILWVFYPALIVYTIAKIMQGVIPIGTRGLQLMFWGVVAGGVVTAAI